MSSTKSKLIAIRERMDVLEDIADGNRLPETNYVAAAAEHKKLMKEYTSLMENYSLIKTHNPYK